MNQPPWGTPPTMLDQYMQPGPPMPGWGPQLMQANAWASGEILVIPIHAPQLPMVCPKSGEPTQDSLVMKLTWQPQWVYLMLLLGLLPFAIASMLTQKRATIRFPMSSRFIARRRMGFIVGATSFFAFLALLIFGASQDVAAAAILSPIVLVAGLVYMSIAANLFKVVKITDQFALVRGVHPSYLQLFAQGPLPVPI